jgi:transcriptional regulator with XRE-family HTH domain
MTAADFLAWRTSLGLNRTRAAEALGMGRNQVQRYEEGQPIPLYIALACAAIARGLSPWPE